MEEGESPRRRDLLRAGAVAGLVAFGWSAGDVSGAGRTGAAADQETTQQTTGDGESAYAFSYDLQEGDRFRVQSRLRTSEGDPVTETIPTTCLGGGARKFSAFVVRAYRGDLQLGYEGLFVPQRVSETETAGTTTTTETPEPANETATATETPEPANETTAANETTTETTQAAIQDETTITEVTTESETETRTDIETTPDGETDTPATETDETTTETTETATRATETTSDDADGLPEIRVGEWYRVASMSKCDSLSRLSLEPAEARTTTE